MVRACRALPLNLQRADGFFEERFRPIVDAYIERAGIDAPPDTRAALSYEPEGLTELNLRDTGIPTIVWATGYDLDYSWIAAPLFDDRGYPRNRRGVTAVPGLFFLGLLWQHSHASTSLIGPEVDAPYLATRWRSPGRRAHPGEDRVVGIRPARRRPGRSCVRPARVVMLRLPRDRA
jgi:putative flavoprotein involved in K+ transport